MISKDVTSLLTIKGNFYDSFLYKGMLYLVTQDARIMPIMWNKFIKYISKSNSKNQLAILSAFCNADWLYYRNHSGHLFDDDIVNVIIEKFEKISGKHFIFSLNDISKFIYKEKYWMRLKELPTQILITYGYLFILFDESIEYARLNYKRMHIFSELKALVNNHRFVSMEYVTGGIALAEQDRGCYLIDFPQNFYEEGFESKAELVEISKNHTSYITRNYSSFLIGSYCHNNYFCFRNNPESEIGVEHKREITSKVFSDSMNFAFSSGDKIYELNNQSIISKKVSQKSEDKIIVLGETKTEITSNDVVVSARASWFGAVLEFKNKIIVLFSNGLTKTINFQEGALINWEIFPNSNQYGNQLHLIFVDRVDIYSFNSDIFVKQKNKLIGSYFFEKKRKNKY